MLPYGDWVESFRILSGSVLLTSIASLYNSIAPQFSKLSEDFSTSKRATLAALQNSASHLAKLDFDCPRQTGRLANDHVFTIHRIRNRPMPRTTQVSPLLQQ